MRYGSSDLAQSTLGGAELFNLQTSGIVGDQWFLVRREEPLRGGGVFPILLYRLGEGPKPLEPRVLTRSGTPAQRLGPAVSPDGRWLVHGEASQKMIKIRVSQYGSTSFEHVINEETTIVGGVAQLALSPVGSFLALRYPSGAETRLRVWKLSERSPPELVLSKNGLPIDIAVVGRPVPLVFSADERWVAVAAGDRSVRLFDLTAQDIAGSVTRLFPNDMNQERFSGAVSPTSLDFSPDGRWLVVRYQQFGGTVFFDLHAGDKQQSQRSFEGHRNALHATFLDGGRRLITVDPLGQLVEWDATELPDKLPPVRPISLPGDIGMSKTWVGDWLSPNRRFLAYSAGERVAIWDLEKDRTNPAFHVVEQEGPISGLTFSPDSRWLVTSCRKGNASVIIPGAFVRLWDLTKADVSTTEVLLPTPERFQNTISERLTITPDNRFLVATGKSQSLVWTLQLDEIYALARSVTGRELTSDERRLYDVPQRKLPAPKVEMVPRPVLFRGNFAASSNIGLTPIRQSPNQPASPRPTLPLP
jgi:WD40 repeat protein